MSIHQSILEYAAQHPEQLAALATGVVATAAHYRKTGRLPIGRLPWRAAREIVRDLGDQWFGKPRPRGVAGLLVDTDVATLETTLRELHFEAADLVSYEYRGEVLNLRRPAGTATDPDTGDPVPMELHVRAFETADSGLLVLTHLEANRYEATGAHLSEGLLSWTQGQGRLATLLQDETDLTHEKVASEADADIEVV